VRRDFVDEVGRMLKIGRKDMIEKDIILHEILTYLSKDKFFAGSYLFKGGTCLIKHYLGYYRFSEDIDFTWKDQKIFEKMSQNEIRRYLSPIIGRTGRVLEGISEKMDLDFKCIKNNKRYVELVGSNKTVTFKLWYDSEILGMESFIKVQINFVDELHFRPRKGELRSLVGSKEAREIGALFPEHVGYFHQVMMTLYDPREIFAEKVRAIMTRRGTKPRDFIDIFLLSGNLGIKADELEDVIISKTEFMLKNYDRFRRNFALKKEFYKEDGGFGSSKESELMILPLDEKDFHLFIRGFNDFLKGIFGRIDA
jgi:predicted nucleotidyltransferase component of viral defense system